MQRISFYLLMVAACFAIGCSDDPASGNNSTKGTVSAKVDGNAWSATNVQTSWANNVLSIGGAQISGAENKQINIGGMVSGPGTYQLGLFSGITVTYAEGAGTSVKTFITKSGTLKVDELTSSGAKGSFSFEADEQNASGPATGKRSVSEGKFDVKF